MSWWSKLFGRKPPAGDAPAATGAPEEPGERAAPSGPGRAAWIPAEKNRFGVPILDLISVTGQLISTSSDPLQAQTAVSWSGRLVADLALSMVPATSIPCELRYEVEGDLPDGWLFTPSEMEEKWAIAYRGRAIYMIRSWTGLVEVVGRTRRAGAELVVERVELAGDALRVLGDPIETFDWLIRTHALGQRIPLPVSAQGAALLEAQPLAVFGAFGRTAACAATSWSPPPQDRPLRSTGDLTTAVRAELDDRIAALVAAGAPLDARSPVLGFTALHVAALQGRAAIVRQLLEAGADPNALADRGTPALMTAVVHHAPLEVLDLLAGRGADPTVRNADGFGLLHAIAETDHAEYLPWALARGLELEARTRHGHTPLHIAAALGHVAALRALVDAGADRAAKAPGGETPRDVALAEGKPAAVEALDSYG